MYPYVIFDLDGTLLDTLEDLAIATNWVCEQHGWPTHPVERFKEFVGNGAPKLLERVTPIDLELTQELRRQTLEEFTNRYTNLEEDHTRPYPGMVSLTKELKERGIRTAVLTNKPHEAAYPIVNRYYPELFQWVQGALPQYPTKPDPTLLRQLMAQMGADPKQTLFVGDSNVDIQTAKNGGLTSCGVLWGFRTRQELEGEGPGFLVESAEELAKLIMH